MTKPTFRLYRTLLVFSLAALLTGCGGGKKAPIELPSAPHPLVIVAIEGLRTDRLGAFGAQDVKTPNLNALARESVAFSWAFAQAPSGAPSLASLLTGFSPTTHRVKGAGDTLPEEARTLAETLATSGYETAAFVDGEGITADLGFAQGFTAFNARTGAGLREVGSRAITWMKDRAGKNFLLLVEASDLARSGGGYDGALAATDAFIGDFVKAFRDMELADRATLVVLGTNGIDLGEHPAGLSLYPTVTRVPLLIRFPGGVRAQVVEEIVEVLDLGPTLMSAAGFTPAANIHGKSLLPLIRGEGKPPYIAFGESPAQGGQSFVALGGYLLIHTPAGERNEIFNLAQDPLGKTDVSGAEEKRIAVLVDHLATWGKLIKVASLDPDKQTAPMDDADLQKLKSLGYVQ